MDAAKAVARGVRQLREQPGLTQADLAEATELTPQYVSQIERGLKAPSLETLDALARALGVTAAELMTLGEATDTRERPPSDRVARLLSAWPRKDQDRLVRILLELRRVAVGSRQ
jgi:XRE family aerobic/anaerobic benzoate catabolism transcriptional regulator